MNGPNGVNVHVQTLVEKYMKNVVRVAYSYLKSIQDAQDIAQDTFVSYLEHKGSFKSEEHEKASLIRACINKCKNFLKRGWHKSKPPFQKTLKC